MPPLVLLLPWPADERRYDRATYDLTSRPCVGSQEFVFQFSLFNFFFQVISGREFPLFEFFGMSVPVRLTRVV